MRNFTSAVNDLFLKEKGVRVSEVAYMEMPDEKEKYNLSKIIGNVNLTEGRYKTRLEANDIVANFLSMPLP